MNTFNLKILLSITIFFISCQSEKIDERLICNDDIKLWKEYTLRYSSRVCCFEKSGKYVEYCMTWDSTLHRREPSDVVDLLMGSGKWRINKDTLHLREDYGHIRAFFLKEKIKKDTFFLYKDYFLVDYTPYFDVTKCDCDSLKAKLNPKGWDLIHEEMLINERKKASEIKQ